MRLPQIRVRTLLVLVAAAAVLIWSSMMGARSYDYNRRSRFYATQEYGWRQSAARGRFHTEFSLECVEYFAQLTRKYRRAMWRPWLPVAPDPHASGVDLWLEQERRAKEAATDPSELGANP
jgi:hypothetical protein